MQIYLKSINTIHIFVKQTLKRFFLIIIKKKMIDLRLLKNEYSYP